MHINEEIITFLDSKEIDIVSFVDISILPDEIRRGYSKAILIGKSLSKEYLRRISVSEEIDRSDFSQKEAYTDRLAESLADFLNSKGYRSYAQSELNLGNDGFYNADKRISILPQKTIALLGGLGWIGKDALLVTRQYGSALSMCTVLTDAPIMPENKEIMKSHCGTCNICKTVCPENAITGNNWEIGCSRDNLVDVNLCTQCLKCLAKCIWTQRYIKSKTS